MKAVLINDGNVRLGPTGVPDDTAVIEFGGAVFAATGEEVILDDGDRGFAFEQTVITVLRDLDVFAPTKMGRRTL